MAKKEKNINLTFKNKKAFHDYFILETYEAGIELKGSEVKSIREGRVMSMAHTLCRIRSSLRIANV